MKAPGGPRRLVALAAASLLLVVATTCSQDESTIEVGSSETTEAEVGDELVIRLSSEPGIGDAWQVGEPPDPAVVRVVDQTSESDEPDVAGGLWEDVFTLEAVGEGRTTVVMHNCFRCDDQGNTPSEYADEAVDITFAIEVR
jgi:hypothetical protein